VHRCYLGGPAWWPIFREYVCSHWLRELPFGDTRGSSGPVDHGLAEVAAQLACGETAPLCCQGGGGISVHLRILM